MLQRYVIYIMYLTIQFFFRKSTEEFMSFKKELSNIKLKNKDFSEITVYRKKLKSNFNEIRNDNLGAGSRLEKSNQTVADVVRKSASSLKKGKILHKLVKIFKPNTIIELGTSLGLGTFFLTIDNHIKVITIEGNKQVQDIAKKEANISGFKSIEFVNARFDDVLEDILKRNSIERTLVFIDGNHRFAPTIKYFNLCAKYLNEGDIVIIDDIHWSNEMDMAWKKINTYKRKLSVDLFFMGIIVLGKGNESRIFYSSI